MIKRYEIWIPGFHARGECLAGFSDKSDIEIVDSMIPTLKARSGNDSVWSSVVHIRRAGKRVARYKVTLRVDVETL